MSEPRWWRVKACLYFEIQASDIEVAKSLVTAQVSRYERQREPSDLEIKEFKLMAQAGSPD
jgi:hypothetical protein